MYIYVSRIRALGLQKRERKKISSILSNFSDENSPVMKHDHGSKKDRNINDKHRFGLIFYGISPYTESSGSGAVNHF